MMHSTIVARRNTWRAWATIAVTFVVLALSASPSAAADKIKIGTVHSQGGAAVFVALAKGFFQEQGLDAELVFFDSEAPISVAAASGDIDFGTTALTAAFCNLANQGSLKIIASGGWEWPGFQTIGFLVSNQAYAAGLHTFKDMKGRKVGITQLGTPLEFDLARVLEKNGLSARDVQIVPLQSNQNVASALKGGATWDAAFMDAQGTRADQSSASEMIDIVAKALGEKPEVIARGIGYFDPQNRIIMSDTQAVLDWYKANGKIKDAMKAENLIDKRFAIEAKPPFAVTTR